MKMSINVLENIAREHATREMLGTIARQHPKGVPEKELAVEFQQNYSSTYLLLKASLLKTVSQGVMLEAFLAYAAKGYSDTTGTTLPIPELAQQLSLYLPAVNIPIRCFNRKILYRNEKITRENTL